MTAPAYSIDIDPAVRRLLGMTKTNLIIVGDSEIYVEFYNNGVAWPIPALVPFVLSICGRESSYDSLVDSSNFIVSGVNELKFIISTATLSAWLNGRRQAEVILEVSTDDPATKQTLARWPVIVFSQGT
jgi:hypothetical protein